MKTLGCLFIALTTALSAQTATSPNFGLTLIPPEPVDPPDIPSYFYGLNWWGAIGSTYTIETSTSLGISSWTPMRHLEIGNEAIFEDSHGVQITETIDGVEVPLPKYFVRLRHYENLLEPLDDDHDRDGVSTSHEVNYRATNPFSYPDDDPTDLDNDNLPDAWERLTYNDITKHAGSDVDVDGVTYEDAFLASRRDQDPEETGGPDGLPDDWERYKNGDSLALGPSDYYDDNFTQLERYRADRVLYARHRYAAQTFRYDFGHPLNKFQLQGITSGYSGNSRTFYYRGDSGGSMVVTYDDETPQTYQAIEHVRVYPGDDQYGTSAAHTHRADYTGSESGGVWDYVYIAAPSTGSEIASDLLRSLDGMPLARTLIAGVPHLTPAKLAITSQPITSVGNGQFPAILRDFPYNNGWRAFPDFGFAGGLLAGMLQPELNGGALVGLPVFALIPNINRPIKSAATFDNWYRHTDALGFNLQKVPAPIGHFPNPLSYNNFTSGISKQGFAPHENTVGSQSALENRHGFTLETHFRMNFDENTKFFVQSDDDLWVFIDGRLAIDSGGGHKYDDLAIRADPYHQSHPSEEVYQYSLSLIKSDIAARDANLPANLSPTQGSCIIDIFYAERETQSATLFFLSNTTLKPVFVYQVIAETDWNLNVSYELIPTPVINGPPIPIPMGITITPLGKIIWDFHALNEDTDPNNNIGSGIQTISVRATDSRGFTSIQTFSINIFL